MTAILRSLAILLLALVFGCQELPTEKAGDSHDVLYAKVGNKPPKDEDPPANWTVDQEIVYYTVLTKKGKKARRLAVASVVENADGSVGAADEAIVLSGETETLNPVWSASGGAVLFEVNSPSGLEGRGVYAVRRDPVTNGASAPELLFPVSAGGMPAMSPDGSKIAYVDFGVEPGDIWVRERVPDGSWGSPVNIDANGPDVVGAYPAWASDSRRLVATKEKDLVVYDIDPDGNGAIDEISEWSITAGGTLEGQIVGGDASWARNDDRVVLGNYPGLWMIEFNDPNNITTCLLTEPGGSDPSWSPDDTKIVYDGDGLQGIAIMTLDPARTQANGCPVIISDDVIAANSTRCSASYCERVAHPNWRRF